jgi:hypothetical protein
MAKGSTAGIPFRTVPVEAPARLNESGFAVIRSDADLGTTEAFFDTVTGKEEAADAAGPPSGLAPTTIDFGSEIGILLPARRATPEPVRIDVIRVLSTGTDLVVVYRESALPPEDREAAAVAPYQMIVVPATDRNIRLEKTD